MYERSPGQIDKLQNQFRAVYREQAANIYQSIYGQTATYHGRAIVHQSVRTYVTGGATLNYLGFL